MTGFRHLMQRQMLCCLNSARRHGKSLVFDQMDGGGACAYR